MDEMIKRLLMRQKESGGILWKVSKEMHEIKSKSFIDWGLKDIVFPSDGKLLHLGCGSGDSIFYLASSHPKMRFWGMDSNSLFLDIAKTKNSLYIDRTQFYSLDINELYHLNEGFFDSILSIENYHLFFENKESLESIFKLLKPGGQFILMSKIYENEDFENRNKSWKKHFDANYYKKEDFQSKLKNIGYNFISLKTKTQENWIRILATK